MKKPLKFFLILFAIIGATIVAFMVWGFFQFSKNDPAAMAEADTLIPAIVAHWDDTILTQHMSSNLMFSVGQTSLIQTGDAQAVKNLMAEAKNTLGDMKVYKGAQCVTSTMAMCVATIEFEKGTSDIVMALDNKDGKYRIATFMVDPHNQPNK